ncbi:MAG: acylphosphatase [Cyclobacteriaceae bacterium]
MSAFSIKVTGVVQGVFFRASTRDKAQSLGIRGWVRNEPDGSVLIWAESEEDVLQELIEWCHQGPPRAEVTDVLVETKEEESYTDFSIRR